MRTKTVYKLELSFDDILEFNEELKEKFNNLSEKEQNKFIQDNQSSIGNGITEGTDLSVILDTVADILNDEL